MQNNLCNERKEITNLNQKLFSELDGSKKLLISDYINLNRKINISDFDDKTISTHKNSADSLSSLNSKSDAPFYAPLHILGKKQNFTNIYLEEPRIRRDNFGREIKKGGKHKIAFADDLDIIKSLTPENPNVCDIKKRGRINSSSSKNLNFKNSLSKFKEIKRSNSFNCDRSSIIQSIYNISKKKRKSKKKLKDSIVHIIEVENLKSETKLNTFSIKKHVNLAEEEKVSCSCYCSIW